MNAVKGNNFGPMLRNERKNRKWSQTDLAEKIGVTQGMVSKWEKGEATPTYNNLITLSKIFNLPLSHFANKDVFGEEELKNIAERKADDLLNKQLEEVMAEQDLVQDLTIEEVKEALEYIKARRIMRRAEDKY